MSLLTTQPWSDGHSPDGVRSLWSSPVTHARTVFRAGLVSVVDRTVDRRVRVEQILVAAALHGAVVVYPEAGERAEGEVVARLLRRDKAQLPM